ncbi:MAG TPA: restriction endonuclease [Isosphaeraceae bacterium]
MRTGNRIPTFDKLMNPLIKALHGLGGSGSVDELYEKVTEQLELPEDVLRLPHNPEKSNQSEVEYRLGWARTYLKKYGLLENSSRGVWAIAPDKRHIIEVDPKAVVRQVRDSDRHRDGATIDHGEVSDSQEALPEVEHSWRSELHRLLTTELQPAAFERLVMRVLRESGFVHVEVTGRSGDGGIDGKGIARLHGFLSFHVVFQCKKYRDVVTAAQVRDFRGAMVGRADKGLFITTGTYTRDAIKEAVREGAPPIDLVDGDQLAEKLKDLGLGIKTETIERVSVDEEWFRTL